MKNEDSSKEQLVNQQIKLLCEISELKNLSSDSIDISNLLQLSTETIFFITENGDFKYISDGIKSLNYNPEELIGQHFSLIIHPEDLGNVSREKVLPALKGTTTGPEKSPKLFDERRSGERMTRDLAVRLIPKGWKNSQEKELNSIHVLVNSSGKSKICEKTEFIGTVVVIRNITLEKKNAKKIQEIQKLESIGILAGGIAHDFNNILTSIIGNITYARIQAGTNTVVTKTLEEVEQIVKKAKSLATQLLTLTKDDLANDTCVAISKTLKDICEFSIRGSNVKCIYDIPKSLMAVKIDEGQFSQIVNNLILNAYQSMPHGGNIYISSENYLQKKDTEKLKKGKYIKLKIKDEGEGIPEKICKNIFDPYFTTKKTGSGLGLTMCYHIINKYDGDIGINSKVGKGSTVTLYLPAEEIQDIPVKNNYDISGSCNGKILIMDDDENILKISCKLLEKFGYTVTPVTNSRDAIQTYENSLKNKNKFDIIIMDLTISGGPGGKETIVEIRKLDKDARVIISSGYINHQVMKNHKEFGFDHAISKPYEIYELIEIINKLIEKN